MANDVAQKTAKHIEWTLQTTNLTSISQSFFLQNHECHLELSDHRANIYLKCKCNKNLPLPMKVTVKIFHIGGSFTDRQEKTITCSNTRIYSYPGTGMGNAEWKFEITFIHDVIVDTSENDKSVQVSSYVDVCFSMENLSRDFSKLLDEGPNYDVEFTVGDQTIKAHKNILCSRSCVFASMLQSDMVEGKTGRVIIKDIEASIFQKFLRSLYTGVLPELTVDTAFQFYEASDKYAASVMKKQCADFLIDNLSLDNAVDILVLSDRHSDEDFKKNVMEFIIKENIPYVGQKWKTLCKENSVLAVEVYSLFCEQFRPK